MKWTSTQALTLDEVFARFDQEDSDIELKKLDGMACYGVLSHILIMVCVLPDAGRSDSESVGSLDCKP